MVLPWLPATAGPPATNAAGSGASDAVALSGAAVDTITLSQGAQQFLSAAAAGPPDAASQLDAVLKAIAVLNNTDGSVSVGDQLQAYDLTVNFVKGPIGSSNVFDPSKIEAMVALLDSPFAQHVQQVLNQVDAPKELYANFTDGNQAANALDRSLAAFNALPASDQAIYVREGTSFRSADAYRANQEASADVDRALQAAMANPAYATALTKATNAVAGQAIDLPQTFGNRVANLGVLAAAAGDQATMTLVRLAQNPGTPDWPRQVQAYFAANGPPPLAVPTESTADGYSGGTSNAYGKIAAPAGYQAPDGKTLVAALAATWDTTGKLSVPDQTAAQQTLDENFLFNQNANSPASVAVLDSLGVSPFEQRTQAAAAAFFWNPAVMSAASGKTDPPPAQTEAGLLNALPLEQQQLIFAGAGINVPNRDHADYKTAATLDDWKAQLAQKAATNHAAHVADPASAGETHASTAAGIASTGAATTLFILTSPKSTVSAAELALVMLYNAARATAIDPGPPPCGRGEHGRPCFRQGLLSCHNPWNCRAVMPHPQYDIHAWHASRGRPPAATTLDP
jgi:hypothetical protein